PHITRLPYTTLFRSPRETSNPRACSASSRRYAVIPPHLSDGDEQRSSEPASTDTRTGTRTSRESRREDHRQTQKPQRTNGTRHGKSTGGTVLRTSVPALCPHLR